MVSIGLEAALDHEGHREGSHDDPEVTECAPKDESIAKIFVQRDGNGEEGETHAKAYGKKRRNK